jgi:hypothetical protein
MFKRIRKALPTIVGAAVLLLGVLWFAAPKAFAGSGNQWCDQAGTCPNAWGGGPLVKSYGYPAVNNDFTIIGDYNECNGGFTTSTCPGHGIGAGWPIVMWQDSDGGAYNGTCAGDYQNNQGDAKMGLGLSCAGTGGWGSNFVKVADTGVCSGYVSFFDIHWSAWLNYTSNSDGNQVYINVSNARCLRALPPS